MKVVKGDIGAHIAAVDRSAPKERNFMLTIAISVGRLTIKIVFDRLLS